VLRVNVSGVNVPGASAPAHTPASDHDQPETDETRPVALVSTLSRSELVDKAVAAWREALVDEAGGSARSDIDLLADAALDLTSAHPSGMAQLFAGRPTRLSNLVRDGVTLATARRRARAVAARADVTTQRYGLAPTSLAIGVATWTVNAETTQTDDVGALAAATSSTPTVPSCDATAEPADPPQTVRVPVLLRPVTVQARGSAQSDYELTLEPTVEVNPVLARTLRARGALLDPTSLAAATFADGGFDPRAALARLTALGEAVLPDFELVDRRVVGTFVHPGQVLVDDLDGLAGLDRHEVVAALAGDEDAIAELAADLPAPPHGDRDLTTERGVGDLDDAQRHVLDVVASGAHVFVDAPTGADVAGTVAGIVAEAAAAGKTVLYVPGSRRGTLALHGALARLGLDDLLLDVPGGPSWRVTMTRRLLGAMTLAEPEIDADALTGLQQQTTALRDQLAAYITALHTPREPWGVSAFDALQHLAALTASRPVPRTKARLSTEAARVIDTDRRAELGADLRRAGELGAFTVRPSDTAWYGADLHTDTDAEVALRRVERLLDTHLPALTERRDQVAAETGLTPAESLTAWAEQLRVLSDVCASLDVFLPEVFERSPADMVAATAPKAWRAAHHVEMTRWARRRLRKQAKDMVRPGRPVTDLHVALREVETRREAWRTHCPAGGWPRLPESFELIEDEFATVRRDVEALEAVLPSHGRRLSDLPLNELTDRLSLLRFDARSLKGLPERTTLLAKAEAAGLGPLIEDLRQRAVTPGLAAPELDLAWWSTVFEQVLNLDPALAGYDGATLEALSEQYAALDRELVATRSAPLLRDVVTGLQTRLRRHREQGESLFVEMVEESMGSLREASDKYPDVARYLRPVLAASPMLVPAVAPPARQADLVVVDAAGHLPTEVAVPALARGRQVVVVGDARCASRSAVRELAQVLPVVPLRADGARRDPHLTAFLAAHGYAGVLTPVPLPDATPLVTLRLVDGRGMPDGAAGIVDSTRAEVDAVVEMVLTHTLTRPDESLAVVTATFRHADAVRDAVLAQVRENPRLAAFFDAGRAEPFVVVDLPSVAGLTRDAVVLSLGLGRTPHRRVLHTFGPISEPGGDALLLDALGSARHRLDVVSCFSADDLDHQRVRSGGPRLLADLLDFARRRGEGETEVNTDTVGNNDGAPTAGADPLLLDIAERLWRHGLDVELDHGLPGGVHIPLVVGHPALPGRFLVAVLTDDEAYVAEPSVRTRDRLVADRLRALGWTVVRIWSAAAFLDPQAEVDRVRRALHALLPAEMGMPPTRQLPAHAASSMMEAFTPTRQLDIPDVAPLSGRPFTVDLPVYASMLGPETLVATSALSSTAPATSPVYAELVKAYPSLEPVEVEPEVKAKDEPLPPLTSPLYADLVRSHPSLGRTEAEGASAHAAPPQDAASSTVQPAHDPDAFAPVDLLAGSSLEEPVGSAPTASPTHEAEPTRATDTSDQPEPKAEPSQTAPEASTESQDVPLEPAQPSLVLPAAARPDVPHGLAIGAYSDDQLDALAAWLLSDGQERTHAMLSAELRTELGITRRSKRTNTVIRAAVIRALG